MCQSFCMRFLTVIISMFFAHTTFGSAASFDCSKATTETEVAICGDPELSALDELISYGYRISRETSLDKSKELNVQRIWIVERDKIKTEFFSQNYSNWKEHLYYFMQDRVASLFEGLIGKNYESIFKLLEETETSSFDFDKSRRVILFLKSKESAWLGDERYQNALFFDRSHNLKKFFRGEVYGRSSACRDLFWFSEDTNSKKNQLHHYFGCGSYGRSNGSEETIFTIASGCIQLQNVEKLLGNGDAYFSGFWKINDGLKICLEDKNYELFNKPPIGSAKTETKYSQSLPGLFKFLTDYWHRSSIETVDIKLNPWECAASPETITGVKLLNLYALFSDSGTFLNNDKLNFPSETGFVGYRQISSNRYVNLIGDYERNKKVYDLFLPLIKTLDTDGSIIKYVTTLLLAHKDRSLSNAVDPCVFKASNAYWYQYTYFIHSGFWERREMDGTTDQTLEILGKLQKILAD